MFSKEEVGEALEFLRVAKKDFEVAELLMGKGIIRSWRNLSDKVRKHSILLTSYLCNLPEVKVRVRKAGEFKFRSKCAARIAELYARIHHLNFIEKDLLGTFLLKLWSKKVSSEFKDKWVQDFI